MQNMIYWLSDQTAFSNPVSDVVLRVSRLPPSLILELNDLAILNFHAMATILDLERERFYQF